VSPALPVTRNRQTGKERKKERKRERKNERMKRPGEKRTQEK